MSLMKQTFSLLLFFLLTVSCTDPSHDSSVQARVDSEHPGMILVEATGESAGCHLKCDKNEYPK
jgi:hypothetical protein